MSNNNNNKKKKEWVIRTQTSYSFLIETHYEFQPPFLGPDGALAEAQRLVPMFMEGLRTPISVLGKNTHTHVHTRTFKRGIAYF